MALAFRIKNPEDFGMLFSAYDEYTSILNSLFGRVLTPNDDYYTSPWCFIKNGDTSGYVVFTSQVSWMHHNSSKRCIVKEVPHENEYYTSFKRVPREHRKNYFVEAREIMKDNWYRYDDRNIDIPYVVLPESILQHFKVDEEEIITFTKDGCYPDKNDISQELEENAVIETCLAMGWQIPLDWREQRVKWRDQRLKYQELDSMVFDLAAYDATKKAFIHDEEDSHKRMKYTLPPSSQEEDGNQQNNPGDNDSKSYDPANYQPQMPPLPSVSNDQSWEEGGEEKKEDEGEHDTPSAVVAEHLDNTCVISHLNAFYGSDDNNEEEGPKPYYC